MPRGIYLRTEITKKHISIARLGKKHSEETIKKMRYIKLGKKQTIETRKKISNSQKNKYFSIEHRKRLSEASKGKLKSIQHRKAISNGKKGKKGKPLSEETKRKISENNKNKKRSEKTRKRMSISAIGRKLSKETIKKIIEKNTGRRRSEEFKRKMSEWQIAHPNKKFCNTIIEQKTATELERRGLIRDKDFFQNFGIAGIKNVDFFLPKLNTVIECDGCFYHACPEHGSPKHHQHVPANDAKNTKLLEKAGYSVFRFWGHDINKSVEDCIDKIII